MVCGADEYKSRWKQLAVYGYSGDTAVCMHSISSWWSSVSFALSVYLID